MSKCLALERAVLGNHHISFVSEGRFWAKLKDKIAVSSYK